MAGSGKRYAIRMAPGMYSNGPRCVPVPLDKAKLWTNIGHLKNHLNGLPRKAYPPGAVVVEVQIVYQETTTQLVQTLLDEAKARREKEENERSIYYARVELEEARKRLEAAERNAKRKGIR